MLPRTFQKFIPCITIGAIALLATACGKKEQFAKQDFSSVAVAGQYTKPKIDIIMVQDNSSSMIVPTQTMKSQLNSFVSNLSGAWDYHFAVIPLQSMISLNGRYIMAQDCSSITSSAYCLSSGSASTFNGSGGNLGWIDTIDYGTGNTDLGFQYMQTNLNSSSMSTTGFLRPDAALAVIVLSNGDDITGMNINDHSANGDFPYLNGQNGQTWENINSANSQASLASFESYLSGIKGSTSLVKFYSVVASSNHITSPDCQGQYAWAGSRYLQVSTHFSSAPGSFDLCSSGLSNVLGSISGQLQSMIQAYKFNYAVINGNPVPSSITVTRNGVTIPQDANNGWTYAGYLTNQPLSYYPTAGNNATGYMVQFHGSAVYSGTDLININFQKQ